MFRACSQNCSQLVQFVEWEKMTKANPIDRGTTPTFSPLQYEPVKHVWLSVHIAVFKLFVHIIVFFPVDRTTEIWKENTLHCKVDPLRPMPKKTSLTACSAVLINPHAALLKCSRIHPSFGGWEPEGLWTGGQKRGRGKSDCKYKQQTKD